MLEHTLNDLRYAVRAMRKNPVFVATAVLTLALAIGANTAMFTIVRAVLLKPLDYRDSASLVLLSGATPTRFAEASAAAAHFAELGAYTRQENVTLSGAAEPEVLRAVHVSANFLRILEVEPICGRDFRPAEDSPGAPSVAMISAELWRRRFGSDPHISGKLAIVASTPYTIIGVLPPRFQFPSPGLDIWMTAPSYIPSIPPKARALSPYLTIFGRLKPGYTLEQADARLKVIRRQYAMSHPEMLDAKAKRPVELVPMKEELVANVRSMLEILLGAVGFVLIIACANLATLLMSRAASRQSEFALRSALGAARGRLIAQLLSESILLSLAGGIVGALLAALCLRAIPSIPAFELPRAQEIHIDWLVLCFTSALSIATGAIFGLAPALTASRPDLMHTLRASGENLRPSSPLRSSHLLSGRSLLSMTQVALSIVLLIGAALLIQSVAALRGVAVGFNPADLLTVNVDVPPLRYDTDRKVASFFGELCSRVAMLPGVRGAAAGMTLPMMDYPGIPVQDAAKPALKLNERLIAKFFPVTPAYFRTLEIPLKRGREFSERDTKDAQRVAIIDESLARRLWPAYPNGLDPIGQRLLVGGVNPNPAEIVGIVGDVKQNLDDRENWRESVYVSFLQAPSPNAVVAIRTAGNPRALTEAVRQQVRLLDKNQPIGATPTMEDRLELQLGQRRLVVGLLGSFAAAALLLAVIGIYGVIAYSVAQRAREIGIRRALGAQRSDILQLVLGQALALAVIGICAGLGGAFVVTRLLRNLLFEVSATDPPTFFAVAVLFLVVALAATYAPARRALEVDPAAALRN
jgi:putative ABC transport system permease protein